MDMRNLYKTFLKPFDFKFRRCHKCGKRLFLRKITPSAENEDLEIRRYICKNENCTITAFEIECERQELLHNLCSN